MFPGMAYELMLHEILNETKIEYQKKYEYKIDDEITIVVVTDFETDTKVFETKFPLKYRTEICEWHKDQMEMQNMVTNKDVYQVQFLDRDEMKRQEKLLVANKYIPSPLRRKNIIKLIKNFNKQLNQYYGR